ncbi:hypothetical protein CC86DRAFT_275840, partial [Ophiobolus disseminans]
QAFHQLHVQNQLLQDENSGLELALEARKKRKYRKKPLDLQQRKEYHGGAVFWSPRKLREARAREAVKDQEKEEEKRAKAVRKDLQASAKLLREQQKEERRLERDRLKIERDQMKAEKAAAREAKKAAQNNKQASTTAQTGKRKASKAHLAERRPKQARGGRAAQVQSPEPSPAPPAKTNSRGRTINKPSRY